MSEDEWTTRPSPFHSALGVPARGIRQLTSSRQQRRRRRDGAQFYKDGAAILGVGIVCVCVCVFFFFFFFLGGGGGGGVGAGVWVTVSLMASSVAQKNLAEYRGLNDWKKVFFFWGGGY